MAEPGDPQKPDDQTPPAQDHAHDDLIGFTSSASLAGTRRVPPLVESRLDDRTEPRPSAAPDEDADLFAPRPPAPTTPAPSQSQTQTQSRQSRPAPAADDILMFHTLDRPSPSPAAMPQPSPAPAAEPTPAWAIETPPSERPAPERSDSFGRVRTTPDGRRIPPNVPPEGAMGLYTVYALILFAVPTLGVAAVVALIAIHGRPRPKDALALSHSVFQQRTVWIAAVAAVLGVLMIAVNLGVFVLFFVALWVLARGASGLLRLSGGRAIENPQTWLL